MTAVRRPVFVLPLAVVALLSACATRIPGEPVPAAGFGDPPQQGDTSPTPGRGPGDRAGNPTGSVAAQPLNTHRIRPCDLLVPADLDQLGGPPGPPHPNNPFPHSCTFTLPGPDNAATDQDSSRNTAAAGYHRPYAAAVRAQPDGTRAGVRGRSSWLYCEIVDGFQTCTATTDIRSDRSLLTMLSLRDTSAADTAAQLHRLTTAALDKLPAARE